MNLTDEQIAAWITTMIEHMQPDTKTNVKTILAGYKKNLHEANGPKDPNKTTLDDVDEIMRRHDEKNKE